MKTIGLCPKCSNHKEEYYKAISKGYDVTSKICSKCSKKMLEEFDL